MYKVNINTKEGNQNALVNHEHKVFLILALEESADMSCRPLNMITGTQFDDIKVLQKGNTIVENLGSVVSKLSASTLDLTLEMRSSEEYLAYNIEQRIQNRMTKVGVSLCNMAKHSLDQAKISPVKNLWGSGNGTIMYRS